MKTLLWLVLFGGLVVGVISLVPRGGVEGHQASRSPGSKTYRMSAPEYRGMRTPGARPLPPEVDPETGKVFTPTLRPEDWE